MNVIEVITSVMSLLALSLLIFLFALAIYFSLKVDKASVSEPDEDSFNESDFIKELSEKTTRKGLKPVFKKIIYNIDDIPEAIIGIVESEGKEVELNWSFESGKCEEDHDFDLVKIIEI